MRVVRSAAQLRGHMRPYLLFEPALGLRQPSRRIDAARKASPPLLEAAGELRGHVALAALRQLLAVAHQDPTHPLRGAIFENLVISELLKVWRHNGERPRLYFWRDRTGCEVDALLDFPGGPVPLEAKAGETLSRAYFKGLGFYRTLQREAGSPSAAADHASTDRPSGVPVYGGNDSRDHWGHTVRPWWAVS